jgi:hypothetical protein
VRNERQESPFSSPGVHAWLISIRAATAFPDREPFPAVNGWTGEKEIQDSHFTQIHAPTGERQEKNFAIHKTASDS